MVVEQTVEIAVPPPATDEAVLSRMRGGQIGAGEELVRRYYLPLIRYLQRLTGSPAVA